MDERMFHLAFSLCPGIGPKRFEHLMHAFGSAEGAWNASETELRGCIGNAFTERVLHFRSTFSAENYGEQLEKKNIGYLIRSDEEYPSLLRSIPSPPQVLYYKGDKSILSNTDYLIGIVGTRKVTSYGSQITETITRELVHQGLTIVSGLALGVDAIAHAITLEEKGKTIAVLGSGVDVCHPETNRNIYMTIIKDGGLVISEYAPGIPPTTGTFPSRNRIIAGMCRGIVVTEGAEDSGSLITAENARAYGRNVYAVPGPITSLYSSGPNYLLKKGATFVTSGRDIISHLGLKSINHVKEIKKGDTEAEQQILDLLQQESLSFDEIVKQTTQNSGSIAVTLSLLELKERITQREGDYFIT